MYDVFLADHLREVLERFLVELVMGVHLRFLAVFIFGLVPLRFIEAIFGIGAKLGALSLVFAANSIRVPREHYVRSSFFHAKCDPLLVSCRFTREIIVYVFLGLIKLLNNIVIVAAFEVRAAGPEDIGVAQIAFLTVTTSKFFVSV